ncbi:MAG: glycosyltransferase family 4 protein [Thermacetogeniaceae bacterium]
MKIALVQDWVVTLGGSERCLQAFHELWPAAPLYTLVSAKESLGKLGFTETMVHTSFLQRFPRAIKWYRNYLLLYPITIEQFDLSDYEIILSSSHAVAKGVLTRSDQLHVCYCHTPIRYAWDLYHQYLQEHSLDKGLKSFIARMILHYIRIWDVSTTPRVDYFIANSHYTAKRIWRAYRRKAVVIYPPVDVDKFTPIQKKENYFIFVSRLVPYKHADLVVSAFTKMGLPLLVIGDGPHLKEYRSLAGKNVSFLGYQPDEKLADLMARARALIFAAEEDFGIVPVEAQACGTPVIAYGKGGIIDTVIPANGSNWDQATGVFFFEQSVDVIISAVGEFLKCEGNFNINILRQNAEHYGRERFKKQISDYVTDKWHKHI